MQKYNNELMEIFEKAKKYDELLNINKERVLHCSFCGKSQNEVCKLIQSHKAYICDECVELCHEIIVEFNGEEDKENVDCTGIILKDSFTFKISNQPIVFKAVKNDTSARIKYDVTWVGIGGIMHSEQYDDYDVKDCLAKGSWIEIL